MFHTCTYGALSTLIHRSTRKLSLGFYIRAPAIFCSPHHCESRGHFHLGLRRLWPQDFQRLSEVQRPNTSSFAAVVCLEVPRPLWDRQVLEAGQQPRNHIEAAVGGAKGKALYFDGKRKLLLYFGGKRMSYKSATLLLPHEVIQVVADVNPSVLAGCLSASCRPQFNIGFNTRKRMPYAHRARGACALFNKFELSGFSDIRIFWKASKTFGARKLVRSHKKSLWLSGHFGGLWVPTIHYRCPKKRKGQKFQPSCKLCTYTMHNLNSED